jgi:hypothetical protein
MGVSIVLFVFDRTRLANVLAIQRWGFYGAELWIRHHDKQKTEDDVQPVLESV